MLHVDNTLYFGNENGRLFALYDTNGGVINRGPAKPIWATFQNNIRRTGDKRTPNTNLNEFTKEIPAKFELLQNFPNPFNPVTDIRFVLPKTSIVKISIYDILGKEIEVLVNEKLSPGSYNVGWDASKHPSGVYLYKLSAGDFVETKKMILIK